MLRNYNITMFYLGLRGQLMNLNMQISTLASPIHAQVI